MKLEEKLIGPFVVFLMLLLLLSFLFINFMNLTRENYNHLINSDTRFKDEMNTLIYYNLIRENAFEKYLQTEKQEYLDRYNTYLEKSNHGYMLTIGSFTSPIFRLNYEKQYELFKKITDYELRVIVGNLEPSAVETEEFRKLKEEFINTMDLPKIYYQIDVRQDIQENIRQIKVLESVIIFAIISTLLLIINQFFVVKSGIIDPIKQMFYVDTPLVTNKVEVSKIKEVMVKNVITVHKNQPIQDIAKIMTKDKIGSVFVLENKVPVGVITEEDLLFNSLNENFYNLKAKDIMTKKLITIDENEEIKTGMKLMGKHHIRHLPAVSKNKLTGVVSINDFGIYLSVLIKLELNFIKNCSLPNAEDIMEKDIPQINWRGSMEDAIKTMIKKKIPYIVITTKQLRVVGIFTERDFVRKVANHKLNIKKLKVMDLASKKITKAKNLCDGYRLSYLFYSNKIRRIPVTKSGKLVGAITIDDFIKKVNQQVLNPEKYNAEKRFK